MRHKILAHMTPEWKDAYEAGMFTEFMEQRAPGHTALDGKVYKYGLLDLKECIRKELDGLDFMNDPEATDKQEELTAMSISCDAAILFAERHADLADEMSLTEKDPKRAAELRRIARLLGGDPDVLVRPLRNDHRTERLGRDESRPFRPASGSVLRKGDPRRYVDTRRGKRIDVLFLHQSEQPHGSSQSRHHG